MCVPAALTHAVDRVGACRRCRSLSNNAATDHDLKRMKKLARICTLAALTGALPPTAYGDDNAQKLDVPVNAEPLPAANGSSPSAKSLLRIDPDQYSLVSAGHGLSLHKPMFVLPVTWSEDYHGRSTEILFDISLKQRLFGIPLYFGYTQKSFWEAFNSSRSSPFRETDFNPELFYRWVPENQKAWHHTGLDAGFEHESNGRSLPDSRSWNRFYLSPFQAAGEHVVYWKWWWRVPEDGSKPPNDPGRDDNPDIQDYYGYSELHFEQQVFDQHLIHAMVRLNPATGRGAFNLQYSVPNSGNEFFWMFYLWQGYGESLIDYNRSITRVGIGVMLAR
jgi:phospholipase A1